MLTTIKIIILPANCFQYEKGVGEQIPLRRGKDGGPGEPAEGGQVPR